MAALSANREDGANIGPKLDLQPKPVGAAVEIFSGALVMINATGFAVPGATATGQTAIGRATEHVDNSGGGDGDERVAVESGIFLMKNSSGADEIDQEHLGDTCYIVDDQTVALTDGGATRSAAGVVVELDDDSVSESDVWVRIGPEVQPA